MNTHCWETLSSTDKEKETKHHLPGQNRKKGDGDWQRNSNYCSVRSKQRLLPEALWTRKPVGNSSCFPTWSSSRTSPPCYNFDGFFAYLQNCATTIMISLRRVNHLSPQKTLYSLAVTPFPPPTPLQR
uniref:Uncharacterized protein n=1 Tax=Macaca fascicularis TaxID=9541 RepID=A0A7N9IC12_MACFA